MTIYNHLLMFRQHLQYRSHFKILHSFVYLNVLTLTLKGNCQNIQAYIFKLLKTWKFLTYY